VKLSQRIGRKTGGIHTTAFVSDIRESETGSTWLFVRGKATMEQTQELLAILRDVLLTANLDNQERFRQMVLEAKARKEASLVPSGHSIVNTRLRAHFSEAGWVAEQMGGVSYLYFLRQLAQAVEDDWPSVREKLEQIRQIIINRTAMVCNVTLDADNWVAFKPQLVDFLPLLPAATVELRTWLPERLPAPEGLAIPAQVNYVGKGTNLYELGYELDGSISVITNFLRTSWLWEKVRAQGGAYGAYCQFDRHSGVFSFLSYRDPNLLGTLATYDRTVQFLRQLDLNQDELEKSIIGAIGAMDAYQLPDAKGYTSMIRYLLGVTDEERQQYRDEILSTTAADFKAFADVLARVNQNGLVVVMGSPEALAAANESRGGWLEVTRVM
ncbi:MAG TPA: peptidase M16, partial [Anaerolineae bacterium]